MGFMLDPERAGSAQSEGKRRGGGGKEFESRRWDLSHDYSMPVSAEGGYFINKSRNGYSRAEIREVDVPRSGRSGSLPAFARS